MLANDLFQLQHNSSTAHQKDLFFWEGHLTDKSGSRVGHLNIILARGAGI